MARPFVLPDLGEGLTEAEVVAVLVKEGDVIAEDAPLLEVETDKAQVEIPSPIGGRVLTVHVAPHQTVRVGEVLVTFADASDAMPAAAGPAERRPVATGERAPVTTGERAPVTSIERAAATTANQGAAVVAIPATPISPVVARGPQVGDGGTPAAGAA